ncbi:unnamed protein product [marine sediment metagenome]|uniref:Carbohydrate-binding module family 96 domain-containing protein n=1 Tax=marine sediment metagenome TaxID=412755 RepID=X0S9M3_9ZZZZ
MSTTLNPTIDVWLYEREPDTNKEDTAYHPLFLSGRGGDTNRLARALLHFDISGLDSTLVVISASLVLTPYAVPSAAEGETLQVYKLSRTDWVEDEATWNSYKSGSAWTSAGGDYVTSSPSGGSGVIPESGNTEIDILTLVRDAVVNEIDVHILIKFAVETYDFADGVFVDYRDREDATAGSRPELVIVQGGSIYPTDAVARVSSIRHIFRPGFFKMQAGLGDLGFDIDVAEASIRRALDTAEEIVPEPPYPPEVEPVFEPPGVVTPSAPTPPAPTPTVPGAPEPPGTITGGGIVGGISSIPGLQEYLAGQTGGQEVKKVRCPYCKKPVPAATLSAHIRTAHPEQAAAGW